MPNTELNWIEDASDPERMFRRMVIGWQMILRSLNATVLAFNDEYLKSEKDKDNHQEMREIAVKKLVIGSLREIKPQLDDWYRELDDHDALSQESRDEKKRVRTVAKQVDKFVRIRNNAFHYGDPNEDTDYLLQLYKDIANADINLLNRVLKDLVSLGEQLKSDAMARCG